MNYVTAHDFYWFCQFRSTPELRRICFALQKDLGVKRRVPKRRKNALDRLEALVDKVFPGGTCGDGYAIEFDVVGQLCDWWEDRAKIRRGENEN